MTMIRWPTASPLGPSVRSESAAATTPSPNSGPLSSPRSSLPGVEVERVVIGVAQVSGAIAGGVERRMRVRRRRREGLDGVDGVDGVHHVSLASDEAPDAKFSPSANPT